MKREERREVCLSIVFSPLSLTTFLPVAATQGDAKKPKKDSKIELSKNIALYKKSEKDK